MRKCEYTLLKNVDVERYLDDGEKNQLKELIESVFIGKYFDTGKNSSQNKYFVINVDEPYAEQIYEILKSGQMAKGEWPEGDIDFEEWKKLTFGG